MNTVFSFVERWYARLSFKLCLPAAGLLLLLSTSQLASALGYAEAWGNNDFGQTGVPVEMWNTRVVAAGVYHTLAITEAGTLAGWGRQNEGQFDFPGGLANVTAVATGFHSVALKSDGTVVVWGSSSPAVTTVPAGLNNVVAIKAGANANGAGYTLALKGDGTVAEWGNESSVAGVPAGLNQVAAIAAGSYHCLALKSNGTVVAWGNPSSVPSGLSNVIAISAGQFYSLALKSDGTVIAWGTSSADNGETAVPAGLNNVTAIAAGSVHALALRSNGTVVAWGYPGNGGTSVPAGLTNVFAISAGTQFGVALTPTPLIRIISSPQSVNTNAGSTVSLTVTAQSFIPLNYQWQKNGTNLPGATSTTLTLTNVQPADAGNYRAVVSHTSASLNSSAAALAVVPAPSFVASPQNLSRYFGGTAFFAATVSSALPVTYQWRKNGTNVINVNSPTLVLGNLQAADGGIYVLIATSASGSVTSAPASLTLTSRPTGAVVTLGGPVVPAAMTNIVAVAVGSGPSTAQSVTLRSDGTMAAWGGGSFPENATVPPGLSNVVAIAAGQDSNLALTSNGVVTAWGLFPLSPPAGLSNVVAIAARNRLAFALKNDGTVVQWGNGSAPAGLSNVVAIAAGAALKNDGRLVVWTTPVVPSAPMTLNGLSNVVGVTVGQGFGLAIRTDGTVTYGDYITGGLNYTGLTNLPGFSNVVAVSAFGQGLALRSDSTVLGYNTTLPAGLTNVAAIAAGYGYSLLLVTGGPVITTHPVSITVNGGESAAFTVAAAGAPPLSYQWQKDGTNLAGATGSTLTLTNVQGADAGNYRVVVENPGGSTVSQPAALTVTLIPSIATPPTSQSVFSNALVTFSVGAVGAVPRSYQWLHDGQIVSGATSSSLTLAHALPGDAGNYALIVSNSYGMATSAPVTLTVTAHTFSFSPPGTVVSLGGPMVPPGLTNVVAVAACADAYGRPQSVALRENGTVTAWGGDLQGYAANVPANLSNVVALAAARDFSLALQNDGVITSWGELPLPPPPNLFGAVAIAARDRMAFALKSDGTVVQWGQGSAPADLSNVVALAAGAALKNDGRLVVWPTFVPSAPMTLNGLSNVVGVAIGQGFGLAIRTGGTVTYGDNVTGGQYYVGPTNLPGFSNVVAVSAFGHGLALKSDGTVLGYATTLPGGLTNVSAISAGNGYSLLITTNPPPPVLAANATGTNVAISTPVSVSGYVLESADTPAGPFTVIETFTNAPAAGATLDYPRNGPKKYFRLRKI
ncbi:MAG: hypothetical protein EXS35_05125 [Pedosphaera sp.]|nr:hypothetical protein [Pedosphaera sp.]